MDWTSRVSCLCAVLIFFGPMLSARSMMQHQWSTLGSKSSGKVPLYCPIFCHTSAKAHPDTEIFRISLSIILINFFFLFFWAYSSTFVVSGNETFEKHLKGRGCGAARQLGLLSPAKVSGWLCGSESSTDWAIQHTHSQPSPGPQCSVCRAGEWWG